LAPALLLLRLLRAVVFFLAVVARFFGAAELFERDAVLARLFDAPLDFRVPVPLLLLELRRSAIRSLLSQCR
jgi:hypothetical protein